MKITINLRHLKAAALFMAVQDVRYYLKNVFIDAAAKTLVATDGEACYIAMPEQSVPKLVDGHDVMLPATLVEFILKQKTKDEAVEITVEKGQASVNMAGASMTVPVGEGFFPPWRSIYPAELSGAAGVYQPAIWARIVAASKALGHQGFAGMHHNGEAAGVAVIGWANTGLHAHIVVQPLNLKHKAAPLFTRFEV